MDVVGRVHSLTGGVLVRTVVALQILACLPACRLIRMLTCTRMHLQRIHQGIFFFSMLNLQPIKMNVTFTVNSGQSLVESLGFLSDVAVMRPLLVMVNALGAMLGNIDGAELRLKSFYVENLLGSFFAVLMLFVLFGGCGWWMVR